MIKDADLKIESMGLLWGLGFVVRPEIVLAQARRKPSRKGEQYQDLTDIDVLGYGFSPLLRMEAVAVDCGSGTSRSIMERVFWHRGVMETAGIKEAICVLGKDVTEELRLVAHNLNIRLVSATELAAVRKDMLGTDKLHDFSGYYGANTAWISYLGQNDNGLANYLLKEHWTREWDRVPSQLPALLRRWNVQLKEHRDLHQYGLLELSILLSIGLVRMALHLSIVKPSDFQSAVTAFVIGGQKRLKLVETLLGRLSEVEKAAGLQPQLVTEPSGNGGIGVPFLPELLDVTHRLMSRPKAACAVPRYIQSFQLANLKGRVQSFGEYLEESPDPYVVKLALDVVRYLATSSGTKDEFSNILQAV